MFKPSKSQYVPRLPLLPVCFSKLTRTKAWFVEYQWICVGPPCFPYASPRKLVNCLFFNILRTSSLQTCSQLNPHAGTPFLLKRCFCSFKYVMWFNRDRFLVSLPVNRALLFAHAISQSCPQIKKIHTSNVFWASYVGRSAVWALCLKQECRKSFFFLFHSFLFLFYSLLFLH